VLRGFGRARARRPPPVLLSKRRVWRVALLGVRHRGWRVSRGAGLRPRPARGDRSDDRPRSDDGAPARDGRSAPARQQAKRSRRSPGAPASIDLDADEQQLAAVRTRLATLTWPPRLLRAEQARVWFRATLLDLGCGWERDRVTIPIRNHHRRRGRRRRRRGELRYAPSHDHAPKALAVRGTRLGLIPHPAAEPSSWVLLVEGLPDMISARSRGLPAVAVPTDDAWEPEWGRLFAGRVVSVVLDCDPAGREAAARIAADLKAARVRGSIVDLARRRADGYDLTEWLAAREDLGAPELRGALGAPGAGPRARCAGG